MTALQTSAAEYALTLTTQLRHELARLLTLPAPQADDAANAMRGAEMTADALVRLLKGNAPSSDMVEWLDKSDRKLWEGLGRPGVIDVEPIESSDAAYRRVFNLLPRIQISPKTTHCVIKSDDAETLLP